MGRLEWAALLVAVTLLLVLLVKLYDRRLAIKATRRFATAARLPPDEDGFIAYGWVDRGRDFERLELWLTSGTYRDRTGSIGGNWIKLPEFDELETGEVLILLEKKKLAIQLGEVADERCFALREREYGGSW